MNVDEEEKIVLKDVENLIDKWRDMNFDPLMCCGTSMCIFLSGIMTLEEKGLINTGEFVEMCLIRTRSAMQTKNNRKNE